MDKQQAFLHHRGPVTCAAHVGSSDWIITSGYDSAVALFNKQSAEVCLLGYHQHLVNRVSVNAAGTLAASASSDYNLYIWDLQTRALRMVLQGHSDDVEDFVFINDELGASVSRDWRIIIWDLHTGAIRRIILGHEKDVLSVNYFDGKLYTSGDDMTLRVWDIDSGKQLAKIGPFDTETDSCAIDEVHKRMVLGCDDGIVRVFDIASQTLLAELRGHDSAIKKVAVSPLNGDILSAAYDQRILIWDSEHFVQKQQLQSQPALWERSFNWTQDGREVVAGSFDGTVVIWDAQSGKCKQHLAENTQGNACFNDVTSCGEGLFAAVSDDGYLRIGQLAPLQANWLSAQLPRRERVLMNAVHYCPAMQKLYTGAHNQTVSQSEGQLTALQQQGVLNLHEGPINSIRSAHLAEFAGDVFIACYSGAVVHMRADGQVVASLALHDNAVKSLELHPTKAIGVSCCAEGGLASWDFNGKVLQRYHGHTAIIDAVAISPSGQFIASAGRDFVLKVHGLEDGKLYHSIHLGRRSPKALCYTTENVVVVSNYWGELIRIDLSSGVVTRNTLADNGISAVVRHGNDLLASCYDGAVYLVDSVTLKVLNHLRAMTQKVQAPSYE
ncbi:WD40 repeat domain-containing protein [Pseudoalteromonas fenneropenaei]|uniref:WD40 repeat domain-containing protein n=1 Tax=Pseudoalteromonas fenneropenaei TaxID=1737459 RepID=A0ABV7CI14_9GAMM